MLRIAQLDPSRAGDGGARINKIGRVEDAGAVLALIAARSLVTAMRAGADNIAIGKEAIVVDRKDLSRGAFFEQSVPIELMIEVLGDFVVLGRMGSAEMIEREAEAVSQLFLDRMH